MQTVYLLLIMTMIRLEGGVCSAEHSIAVRSDAPESAHLPQAECRPMPAPLAGHAACESGEQVYVLGGGERNSKHFWKYETTTDRWSSQPDALRSRTFGAMTSYDGKVVVVGGLHSPSPREDEYLDNVDCFDESTGKWSVIGKMPAPRSRFASVRVDQQWWILGGYSRDVGNHVRVDILDLESMEWRRGPDLPEAIHGCAAARTTEGIVILGNQQNGERAWLLASNDDHWERLPDAPDDRLFASAVSFEQSAVFMGDRAYGDIPLLRFRNGQWQRSKSTFVNVHRSAAVLINGSIYSFGGETENGTTDKVLKLAPAQIQWIDEARD